MKKLNILLFGFILSVCLFSCTDDLAELNVDPNEPTDVPAANLLTNGEFNLFSSLAGTGLNASWGLLMTQQLAQNEYTQTSRYEVDGNSFNGTFLTMYASVLNELQIAKEKVEAQDLPANIKANQKAVIDILMAYSYQILTDGYGAIPYSEALNASEFPNPAYDSQDVVYKGILDTYLSAVQSIDTSAPSFSSGEAIYGGDMMQWKKLGNSLMLKAAMRYAEKNESGASSYIQSASSDLIMSNSDNALFQFTSSQATANPFYVNSITRDDHCVTELLVTTLTDLGDPRLGVYAAPNLQGEIVGMPYGLPDADAFALKNTTSRPNPSMTRQATTPFVIMSASEVYFFLAEAYQRGLLSGDATTAYNNAVEASMNQWGISDSAAIAGYLEANSYDDSNWKMSIGMQKWLALYMNGYEGWAEQRRLDYPALQAPSAGAINMIPKKLPYPISEQTNNESNLSAVSSNYDSITEPVWWDVN